MILNAIIKILLFFCAISAIIILLPNCLFQGIRPRIYPAKLPVSLAEYEQLDNLNINELSHINYNDNTAKAPESIAIYKDKLVTGSFNGILYLINQNDNSMKSLVKIIDDETIANHGTPLILGLQFDSKGVLFVTIANYGIYKVDGILNDNKNPKVSQVFSLEQTQLYTGKLSKLLDDIAIEERPNGQHILYVTDLSTQFSAEEFSMSIMTVDHSGRILRYDMSNNQLDILVDNLLCPNGIVLVPDRSALLFTDFSKSVKKFWLKGPKAGLMEKILENLPAELDNIRTSSNGKTFWIAMSNPRTLRKPSDLDYFLRKPWLRTLILRTLYLIGSIIKMLNELILANEVLDNLANDLQKAQGIHPFSEIFMSNGGMIMEIDSNGKIYQTIYTNDERLKMMSEIREMPTNKSDQRTLYIGSWMLPYVRKLTFLNNR